MHELSVAMALYEACRKEAHGTDEILVSVRILIGELGGVEPDLIKFAWSACIEGTPDKDALLEIQYQPARQVCNECGPIAERQPGSWLRLCPHCMSPLCIEGGDELDIIALSFERAALVNT